VHAPEPWTTIGGIAQPGRACTLCGGRGNVAARFAKRRHEISGARHSKTASTGIPGRKSGNSVINGRDLSTES
jgi:hypothetical protein